MLRVLLCISCCSTPPSSKRSTNHKPVPNQLLNGVSSSESSDQIPAKSNLSEGEDRIEKDQLLTNQIQANNENHGIKSGESQGKLILRPGENKTNYDAIKSDDHLILQAADSVAVASAAQPKQNNPDDHGGTSIHSEKLDTGFIAHQDDYNGLMLSSIEIDPLTESVGTTASSYTKEGVYGQQVTETNTQIQYKSFNKNVGSYNDDQESSITSNQPYEPLGVASKNVPSTTKIGDYARIEYSPVEDLESVTTMSYSRFGSEKGGGNSRGGSTLSRHNSLKANTLDGSQSRRSSQGGVESTSISISSQLSNEQLQQNLTNMLESVNSNYQTIGVIGLPLGPPIDGTLTETAKTSPETPGAALTSASQDSLSDATYDDINPLSRIQDTLRSNDSTGAALVVDSLERSTLVEELADFAQPAPLATGEDEDRPQARLANNTASANELKSDERMGSPQSIATTTSGGLTNPTPTPSEMSGGSGKKKRLKAKSLLKKLRPGSKKKNKDDPK